MATYKWTGPFGGDWNTAGDWSPTSGPPGLVAGDVANLVSSSTGLSSFTVTVGAGTIGSFSPDTLNISAEDVGHEVGLTIESGAILTTGTLALSDALNTDIHININNAGILNIVDTITSSARENIDIESTGVTAGGRLEFGELGSTKISGIDVNDSNVTFNFLGNPAGEQSDGVIEYLSGFVPGLTTTQQNISGVSSGDGFIFDGADFTDDTATLKGSTLTVTTKLGATVLTMDNISTATNDTTFVASGNEILAVCYTRGTMIQTPTGERPVETLRPGMQVITTPVDGGEEVPRTVKWVGHRRIDLTRHPRPETMAPIRIERDAFDDNVPHADLLLSPDHAVFVDGMLICIRQLVNGFTIRTERGWTAVDYYHVELNDHGILLAEGLQAESYLDTGNSAFFVNSGAPQVLHPNLPNDNRYPTREAGSCAPFVWDEASVQPVWQRLADRAAAIGQPVTQRATTADASLRLIADQRTVKPVVSDSDRVIFVLPRDAHEVRLVSRAQSPTEVRPWLEDRRRLGVRVKRIVLRGADELREIPVDHPDLTQGWWALERDGPIMSRWTDGDAVLPLPVMSGTVMLEIHLAGSMTYAIEAAPEDGTEERAAA